MQIAMIKAGGEGEAHKLAGKMNKTKEREQKWATKDVNKVRIKCTKLM